MPSAGAIWVELKAEIASFKSGMEEARRSLSGIESHARNVQSALNQMVGGYLSFQGAIRLTRELVAATVEQEQAQARLNAVFRATGGAAGLSVRQLTDYAEALSRSTLFDSAQIKSAEAELSIFRNIHGDTFRQAIKLAMDLSQVTGRDLMSTTLMLGKALNDPISGYTTLGRAIGRLSPEVQRAIKDAMAHKDALGAQKLIVDELTKSIGGAAGAANTGLSGSLHAATEAWKEFLAEVGKTPAFQKIVTETLQGWANILNTGRLERESLADPGNQITARIQALRAERAQLMARASTLGTLQAISGETRATPEQVSIGERIAQINLLVTAYREGLSNMRRAAEPGGKPITFGPTEADLAAAQKRQDQIKQIMAGLREDALKAGFGIRMPEMAKLSADQEKAFQKWAKELGITDVDAINSFYDYRAAFLAGEGPTATGHWTDRFKLPGHPTFSNESIYAQGLPPGLSGHWEGEKFIPPLISMTTLLTGSIEQYRLVQAGASTADRNRAEALEQLKGQLDNIKEMNKVIAEAPSFQIDLKPELRSQAEIVRDFWAKHGKLAEQLGVPVGKPDDMDVWMNKMGYPSAKQVREEYEKNQAAVSEDTKLYATAWKEAIRGIQQTFADFYANLFTQTNSLRDLIVNMLNAIKTAAANLLAAMTTNWIGKALNLPGYGGGGGGMAEYIPGLDGPRQTPITINPVGLAGRTVAAPSPSVVNVYMTNHLNANSFDPHTGAKLLQSQAGTLMGIWYKGMQDMGIQLGRRA